MLEGRIQEGLTYDDILIVPARSRVLPKDVDVSTLLAPQFTLSIPLISAAMDTVTESKAAITMAQEGGIGIIHKNWSIESQAAEVAKVKRFESGLVDHPVTVAPGQTLGEVEALSKSEGVSGFPVTEGKKLVGMLTRRDFQFETDTSRLVSQMMTPTERLVTAKPGTSLEEAKKILHQHRIEKLPIVDANFHLQGLITIRDIKKVQDYPKATKDANGRLRVGVAVGVGDKEFDRASACVQAGVDLVVIDTAHGHSEGVIEMTKRMRKAFPDLIIVAGNIATADAAEDLISAGASILKVGVGPGSICTTRIISGCGVPQVTALSEVLKVAKKKNVPVIADGGVKHSGDMVKALAVGASAVMVGSLFAGTEETPGEAIVYQGRSYKLYRGMGSLGAMQRGSKDRYFQGEVNDAKKLVPEGIEGRVPYRGKLRDVIYQLIGGLRSGMGYAGSKNLLALASETRFVKITSAGLKESHVHDVVVTEEAPNYRGA